MLRRLDGTTFPGAITSQLIEYEGDVAFVTSVLDLTERAAAEAQIQRQRDALHQSEKLTALGSLLAGVAHELNNPLSVVVGYSSMLKELAQDDGTRQRAERVHAAAERCARIVKTFLAMARSRPPQRGPVAINEVMEDALDLAGYGLRTADVEIVRELEADLPQVLGRQRPAASGAHQPDRQRAAGAAAVGAAAAPAGAHRATGRRAADRDRRQRSRHRRRGAEADLRAVLHHQAARRRHRRRLVGLPRHRRRAPGPDHGRQRARPGHALRRDAAAAARHDGGWRAGGTVGRGSVQGRPRARRRRREGDRRAGGRASPA